MVDKVNLSDGFGSTWDTCGKDCWLEIVRPGKVQCNKPGCPKNVWDEDRVDTIGQNGNTGDHY